MAHCACTQILLKNQFFEAKVVGRGTKRGQGYPQFTSRHSKSIGAASENHRFAKGSEIVFFTKNPPKSGLGGPPCSSTRSCPKPKIQKMSHDVTSVSVGETSCATTNDYQIIRNHARGNSRANGGVGGDVHALFCRPSIFEIFRNDRKRCRSRTYENQGTPSPSLAQDCKCAFGATNNNLWSRMEK